MRIEQVSIRSETDAMKAAQLGRAKALEALRSIVASLEQPIDPKAQRDWGYAGDEARTANELVLIANRLNGHTED